MAVVIYDMQIGIVRQMPEGPAIVERIAGLLATARDQSFRVIFMRHMSMPRELMGVFQYRQAMAWQRTGDPVTVEPWFLRDSPGFDIVPELAPRPSDAVRDKIAFSAFESTPLAIMLRDCALTSFAARGIATEIGIDPTVHHGADLGFVPVMVADACGAGHAEAGQRSLDNIAFMSDAIVTDVASLSSAM